MAATSRGALPTAAVLVSVVLWSTAYGLSALVLVTASPAVLSELRLVLALPVLIALVIAGGSPRRRLGDLGAAMRRPFTAVLGLTGVALFYLPSNLGLALSTPGTAALMSASLPVLTALLAWLLIRERLTARVALGLVLATVGIVIGSAQAGAFGLGAVLLVAGLLSYALYTVLLRRLGSAHARRGAPESGSVPGSTTGGPAAARGGAPAPPDSFVLATATALWGAAFLLPWVGGEVVTGTAAWPSDATGWVSILFLALVVTGPTMALYNYGAERVPAALSGVAAAAVPALAYAFAVLLGEPLDGLKVVGGLLALAGIAVAAMPPVRSRGMSRRMTRSDAL